MGTVLLTLGLLSVVWTFGRAAHARHFYIHFDLQAFLVIAGIYLRRGSLRMARFMAFVCAMEVALAVAILPVFLKFMPAQLVVGVMRGHDLDLLIGGLFAVATTVILGWTYWRLSEPTRPRTWEDGNLATRPRRPWIAIAVGVVRANLESS